ncbi:uncharacterized protein LOC143923720 isoform X1 [Lithobates pipiens]
MFVPFLLLLFLQQKVAALQMTGPSTYEARVGSIAHIPCTFIADTLPADPRYFAVVWSLEGKLILSYDDAVKSTDPRYSLNIDGALNGIADLTISNTFLSDGGIYTCSVTNSPIQRVKEIKVEISGAALQMTGPSTYEARVGSNAHIPCTFTADKRPADPRYFTVFWYLEGKHILNYDKTVTSTNDRYLLDKDQALHGIADLIISNTLPSDGGIYTCLVNYSSFLLDKKIRMNVSAQPRLFILGKSFQRNTENNLTCMASGFFPNNIHVTWYKDGEVLKNQSMGEPLQYDNGTYQVNSTVTITPIDDDQNKTLSCRIQHVSLEEPLREDFQITYGEFQSESSSQVGIIIGIVIAGVIILIGIIAAVICRRRKPGRKENQSANKTRGNPTEHSEEPLLQSQENRENQSANKTRGNPTNHSEEPLLQIQENRENQSANKTRGNPTEHSEELPLQIQENRAEQAQPRIGEIMVPELTEGEAATLECKIYNFKLGEHKVKWHQTQDDKMINVCKNSNIKRDPESNDRGTYIVTLTLPAVQMSDCGTKYVCEVHFSGGRLPIQKTTKSIQVKAKNQASLQEAKDQCTESPIAEILAEINKPPLSDQRQTWKPEIKPRMKYEKQPQRPVKLKKDNIDTDLASPSSSKLKSDDQEQSTNLDNTEEKNLKQNPPNSTNSEENIEDSSMKMRKDQEDQSLGSQTPNEEEIKLEGGDTEEPTFLDSTDTTFP